MKKIDVTVGISNSGKSTWAHEQWLNDPLNIVLVNRDKIRELLFGYTEKAISQYYNSTNLGKLEKQVTKYEDTIIHEALNEGKRVIVDATHLDRKYIERFKFWNVPVNIEWFDITLKEALTRDMSRNRQVGEDIITKQYGKYINLRKEDFKDFFQVVEIKNQRNLPPTIIYDIDGTIAEKGDRSAYDWKKVGEDLVIQNVVATIDWLSDDKPKVIICTGRDGVCLRETKEWLKENGIYYDEILIRVAGDMRPDWVIKEEMWRKIAETHYIVGMYDDRLQVVRRARALGLKVFNVEYNNF